MASCDFLREFIKQVLEHPSSVAIECGEQHISYDDLYKRSCQVANYLYAQGIRQVHVGILVDNSIQSYANIIGVWMYGAAYVPINTHDGKQRIQLIKTRLSIKTVLSGDEFCEFSGTEPNSFHGVSPKQEIAYVIHTSGTTGMPKAISISHENLNAFISCYLDGDWCVFNSNDRFLQSYELSFDVSVFCYALPLMIGATLILPEDKGVKYLTILACIIKKRITVCSNVPSLAKYAFPRLSEVSMDSLRYCFFSGESLHGNWAMAWMKAAKNAQVYNCYGPTETTIVCTWEHLNKLGDAYFNDPAPLPLGTPFKGVDLKLVDDEIYLKGAQVFSGYDNDSDDVDSTIQNGFFPTGDLAFFDDNKKLIFKGRKDEQVQINGYRVELGAVDAIIRRYFDAFSKTILFHHEGMPDRIVTLVELEVLDVPQILNKLSQQLPAYGLPAAILPTKRIPINENGKVSRSAIRRWITKNL
jgi:D-alanine--poly(phosphoribitol) ligase subunit 1